MVATNSEPKKKSFSDDLFSLHAELDKIDFLKQSEGSTGNRTYMYIDLPSIMSRVRPLLRRHNFIWTSQPGYSKETNQPTLVYTLLHQSGECLNGEMLLMLKSPDPQGQGSAITYGRRYALTALLDIVADEDDDGAKAQAIATEKISKKQQDELVMLLEQIGRTKEQYESKYGVLADILASDFDKRKTALEKLVEQHNANNA